MFWDKLKPSARDPRPLSIDMAEGGLLVVSWDDGKKSSTTYMELRLACPCASCVDEWTGAKLIDPNRIPGDVRPVAMEPVGNYAVQIRWSDGHETGIYSWRLLRTFVR